MDNTRLLSDRREEARRPCLHGTYCDGTGLDCGPDWSRKKPEPKPAAEASAIRVKAWETRRAKYGERGHRGSYAR